MARRLSILVAALVLGLVVVSLLWSDERAGPGLPYFVRRELYRYFDCGILTSGFARVHCRQCGRDELVAFSCKGRGFCP